MILLQIVGTLLGFIILIRAVSVINKMSLRTRQEDYWRWLGFGIAYALLAAAAAGSVLSIWGDPVDLGAFAWLGASAGLILFDRRRRRPYDADTTLQPVRPFWMFWSR